MTRLRNAPLSLLLVLVAALTVACGSDDDTDAEARDVTTSEGAPTEGEPDADAEADFPIPCDHLTLDAITAVVGGTVTEASRDATAIGASCSFEVGEPDDSPDIFLSWIRPENASQNLYSSAFVGMEGSTELPDISPMAVDVPSQGVTIAVVDGVHIQVRSYLGEGGGAKRLELFRQLVAAFPG